ncbi:MAG: hypothetical protein MUC50_17025 [Myxococcota bacterium]|jgi:hypothetical protein|nr:hypothetical protein [Myxococcota bacterium]
MKRAHLLLAFSVFALGLGCAKVEVEYDGPRPTDTGSGSDEGTGSEPDCESDTDCKAGRYCNAEKTCSPCGDTDASHCGQECAKCSGSTPFCQDGNCVAHCTYDEDSDGISDVVEQEGTSPVLCWRRCPLPQKWNGSECTGTVGQYLWLAAKNACEALGYRLPTAPEYLGPSIASGILQNCTVVLPDDWACDSCDQSSPCAAMFGSDTGKYWSSTYIIYFFIGCYYEADFATGNLNYFDPSNSFGARCVK